MSLVLYQHPFASYCQKVLIALYENDTPFEWRMLSQDNPQAMAELAALWPLERFPLLVDEGRAVMDDLDLVAAVAPFNEGQGITLDGADPAGHRIQLPGLGQTPGQRGDQRDPRRPSLQIPCRHRKIRQYGVHQR